MDPHQRGVFPFGATSLLREARPPRQLPAALFVLGVYPSALHIRWDLPRWAVKDHGLPPTVSALAVDVEPVVFWDGHTPAADDVFQRWLERSDFVPGDGPGHHGRVIPSGNGSSGRAVMEHVLKPLGFDAKATWFTDALPWFFVKRSGSSTKREQGDVLDDIYEPFAAAAGLPSADLSSRPSRSQLVTMATTTERRRLREELAESGASSVVTLGEEARRVLVGIADEADGLPTRPLHAKAYGDRGRVRVGNHAAEWYALVHPGNRSAKWRQARDLWKSHVAGQPG